MKSYKIKHKEEGWTGKLRINGLALNSFGSHSCSGKIGIEIIQDAYDKKGNYHEDPEIESLDELEFIN